MSADFVVSKHINGREWVASQDLGGLGSIGWEEVTSTQKQAIKKAKGKAQTLANQHNKAVTIDVYKSNGDYKRTIGVEPVR